MHVLCTLAADLCAQSELGKKKILHCSSVGSLLRVRCWLGRQTRRESATGDFFLVSSPFLPSVYFMLEMPHRLELLH